MCRQGIRQVVVTSRHFQLLRQFILGIRAILAGLMIMVLNGAIRSLVRRRNARRQACYVRGAINQGSRPTRPRARTIRCGAGPCGYRANRRQVSSRYPCVRLRKLFDFYTSASGASTCRFNRLTSQCKVRCLRTYRRIRCRLHGPIIYRGGRIRSSFGGGGSVSTTPRMIMRLLLFPYFFGYRALWLCVGLLG